ncbi:MAG: DNA topoisomerase IV subunit A [Bifidobacteriaceae bacterium]|jgi:DNA gyrase subunit A|nr:DNA topoisomerase IV subunit A [Bifidobacteriaceae bacterium]
MAKRAAATLTEPFEERITDIDVSAEMSRSFLEYAYSVIYARALPDARDGLKPVQRRILYQMSQMRLTPDRPHVKSARVVGDVMGRLHPHGDSAIYDALVRLAQPFSLRLPMVDGHGNFGSLDDGPAAPRYTEARMAPAAVAMTAGLDEDMVDFVPNYDSSTTQPSVLPAAIPNLLVNGASGIAVGMATNMPPHNLVEVCAAARHLLVNPDATPEELMRLIPGPDLPGGGLVVGLDGIRDAYLTGRGVFRVRAAARVEKVTARRMGIVVTELPYLVGPEKVIEKIKDQVQARRLQGISAVTDLTDRKLGLRLLIEVKSGFNPEAVLSELYRLTPMEDSFAINNLALVDGQPRTLGLKDLLHVFIGHRLTVVRRRTSHRLERRRERRHLVEGLLIAVLNIDEVIQVIRTSDDAAAAKERLVAVFGLSEAQAEYILELRLRRLTRFSQLDLEQEADQLATEIAALEQILSSDQSLRSVVSEELTEVAAQFGSPRRTVLLESDPTARPAGAGTAAAVGTRSAKAPAQALEVQDVPCWVVLSATGLMARTATDAPVPRDGERTAHDAVRSIVPATSRSDVAVITTAGRALKISCLDLPVLPATAGAPSLAGGARSTELFELAAGEKVVGLTALLPSAPPLALGTATGVVKRLNADDIPANRDEWQVIGLKDGDQVIGCDLAPDNAWLVFITSDAQLLRFESSAVRPQGRAAGGMAGIKLASNAAAIFFGAVDPLDGTLVVTIAGSDRLLPGLDAGAAKVTPLPDYPAKGRATGGVRCQRFLKNQDSLIAAWAGPGEARAVSNSGKPVALPEIDNRRDGSGTPLKVPVGVIG